MNKLDKDRLFAIGSTILALYLGYESFSYPVESAFFPQTLSVILGGLSLLLLVRLGLKKRTTEAVLSDRQGCDGSSSLPELLTLRSAGFVFGSIIAYGLLMSLINYEAASVIFLVTMMVALGFKKPLPVAGISLGFMLLLYTIFFKLLGVSRPESLWF